ncbi:hypothetical protein PENSTE_c010G00489 [Penicillium steckii]|uniref:SWR1-complex protein 3 domain-containing protein n=1 Tax=Penicillium steckii TaxID=303698 RepID=A0A1V6T843_9EURO|nr:hypothetical protein PENSTE_c010G00489 [Penicillium steckii]
MAEKRKLPPRAGREPAAKRRVSEAVVATPQSQKKKKKEKEKAPTPCAPSPPPEPVEEPLPSKLKDADGIPVTRAHQSATLSDSEYQSIAESAVLLASLERSKKKWLSEGILVRYYTKPKKTKREQIEKNNPPKESMTRIGPCDITIGPHLFDAMIYTVKDPNAPPQIQYAPPQRPMVHYGHPNSFQQYQPYPNQQKRPPHPSTPTSRPAQGYPGSHQPPNQQRGPQAPPNQQGQRPTPTQNGQPGQPAKPSPDPVIQMLATRAAADPELKALMRVVASSQASQEQLRAFQAHIDELNAIIKAREQQEQKQQNATGTPGRPQPATPASQNKPTPTPAPAQSPNLNSQQKPAPESNKAPQAQPQNPPPATATQTPSKDPHQQVSPAPNVSTPTTTTAPKPAETPQAGSQPQKSAQDQNAQIINESQSSNATPAVKQEPGAAGSSNPQANTANPTHPTPAASTPSSTQTPLPNSTSIGTPQQQQTPSARPPQPPSNYQQPPRPGPPYPPYQQPSYGPGGAQAPLQSRPPQYGSPTPYYRPPGPPPPPARVGYKSVVFEFTSPLTPYGSSTSGHAGSGDRYLLPEHTILEWIPNECTILASFLIVRKVDPNTPFPIEIATDNGTARKSKGASKSKKKKVDKDKEAEAVPNTPAPGQPATTDTPLKQEPSEKPDSKVNGDTPATPATPNESAAKEVTLKEYWQPVTFRIHAQSPKILEPLTRVVKPADEVRKYMNEIMDRAERAPDGFPAMRLPREEALEGFESEGTPALGASSTARSRPSRAAPVKPVEEESEVETTVPAEEEEELLEIYGAPSGLPPLRV